MLKIRLKQVGKKNKKMFRLVVSDSHKDTFANSLDILGFYNPHTKELNVKQDNLKSWLEKGAQMSPTVNNLLVKNEVIEGKLVKASKNFSKKIVKKQGEKQEKAKVEKETVKEEAPAEEETKTEEAPAEEETKTEEAPAEEEK